MRKLYNRTRLLYKRKIIINRLLKGRSEGNTLRRRRVHFAGEFSVVLEYEADQRTGDERVTWISRERVTMLHVEGK